MSAPRTQWTRPRAQFHWVTCEDCGKRTFFSRKDARAYGRQLPGEKIPPYRCPVLDSGWHVGHLGQAVKLGMTTRDELYGRAA